jgi:hypothetical protein
MKELGDKLTNAIYESAKDVGRAPITVDGVVLHAKLMALFAAHPQPETAQAWPSESEMHEQRKSFHRRMGATCGIPESQIEGQIESIGRVPWEACYQWLRARMEGK